MLAELRQSDRQPPPEEIKPDRQETRPDYQQLRDRNQELEAEVLRLNGILEQVEELNSAPKPDLFALRDRVLKTLTTGRRAVGTTSPQFKSAVKTLDRFIEELQKSTLISTLTPTEKQINTPESQATWEDKAQTFLEEANWHE